MRNSRLSGIYVAIERMPDGKTVSCTGIASFTPEGRISGEETGGRLEWRTRHQSVKEIKQLVLGHINTDSERMGVRYEVADDRIFLVDRKTYRRVLKKAENVYSKWLEQEQERRSSRV